MARSRGRGSLYNSSCVVVLEHDIQCAQVVLVTLAVVVFDTMEHGRSAIRLLHTAPNNTALPPSLATNEQPLAQWELGGQTFPHDGDDWWRCGEGDGAPLPLHALDVVYGEVRRGRFFTRPGVPHKRSASFSCRAGTLTDLPRPNQNDVFDGKVKQRTKKL